MSSKFKNLKQPSFKNKDTFYLFNHVDFEITYHDGKGEEWGSSFLDEGGRIVNAKVDIRSIKHPADKVDCTLNDPLELTKDSSDATIKYTYSVKYTVNIYNQLF